MTIRHLNPMTGRIEEIEADEENVTVSVTVYQNQGGARVYPQRINVPIGELRRMLAEPTRVLKPRKAA